MDKLKKIIDKIENESFSTENKYWIDESWLRELKSLVEEKWEPKCGEYILHGDGRIVETRSEDYARMGCCFPTTELAETARDMNKRNQLILQAKHEMGYGDGEWAIVKGASRKESKWTILNLCHNSNPELSLETYDQAETVFKMVGLNG